MSLLEMLLWAIGAGLVVTLFVSLAGLVTYTVQLHSQFKQKKNCGYCKSYHITEPDWVSDSQGRIIQRKD